MYSQMPYGIGQNDKQADNNFRFEPDNVGIPQQPIPNFVYTLRMFAE